MTNKVLVPIGRLIWKQSREGWVGLFFFYFGMCLRFREKKKIRKVKSLSRNKERKREKKRNSD